MKYKEIAALNRKKTYIVIGIYLMIYTFIGLLLDTVIYDKGTLIESLHSFITLEVIPKATIGMFSIGAIMIYISIFFFRRIQLSGEDYIKIEEDNQEYKMLINIMDELRISANMKYTPEIYVIDADYMNAFASGWNEKNTMVAISRGLYESLNRDEIEAVMAHELTHIRNEDIKLTLIIGVASNIMLFVVNNIVYFLNPKSDAGKYAKMMLFALSFILPIITIILQMWMSRSREYMADAGSVELTRNPSSMRNALIKISGTEHEEANDTRNLAYIYSAKDSWFSKHPSIDSRLEAIGNLKI